MVGDDVMGSNIGVENSVGGGLGISVGLLTHC